MWNPFKAIGRGISAAGKGIAKAVTAPARLFKREKPAARPSTPVKQPAAPKEGTRVMPTVHAPAKEPAKQERRLPPSMGRGPSVIKQPEHAAGMAIDEGILGADSDQERALTEAVKEFESEHSLLGLNKTALAFIDHPSFAAIFDRYSTGSGFSTEQWVGGMSNVRNVRIDKIADGRIHILFDAEYEIGDYDLGSRSAYATF